MHRSKIFGTLVFASVAIVAAPAPGIARSTSDEMEPAPALRSLPVECRASAWSRMS